MLAWERSAQRAHVCHALRFRTERPFSPNFRERRYGEVRRIPLLRRWVNKGKKKGRRCYTPALDDSLLGPLLQTEGLGHLRGEIGVVVHYLPSVRFPTVDVRHAPGYA